MAKIQTAFGTSKNTLLTRLSHTSLETLRPHLKGVELEVKKVIYEPNKPIEHAYFVESGMISLVSVMRDGGCIEVGTVGKEGMVGGFLLLGTLSVPYQQFVQMAGTAYRIDAEALMREADRNLEIRDMILKYQAAFQTQAMQAAACNGLHSVSQRCCRWLLMSLDRAESDTVPLTHEFLGLMLGVRRASVSEVLRPLQVRGWLESNRGEITINDRKGLESGSCECYRIISDHHKRLLADGN
jgi:CRP-like cAMP-binding protein